MAYRDENGRITIDEQAAQKDIRRLREAANILKDSRASIRSLRQQSGDMQGLAVSAIQDKSLEMDRKLTQMIEKLEDTADCIQKVVRHYQKIDEDLKKIIQQAAIAAGEAVAGVAGKPGNGSGSAAGGSILDDIGKAAQIGIGNLFSGKK